MHNAGGARVALAARDESALTRAVDGIRREGGRAIAVAAEVAEEQQIEHVADAAVGEFGRIDTWVNNAAVSMYGRTMDVTIDDMRRQMDVNYWGQVYGSREYVRYLRDRGGALINVGSALCDRAIPLQVRELIAGGSGAKLSAARFAPRLADLYMTRWTFASEQTAMPVSGRSDNLYEPVADDGGERGRNWSGHTRETSLYTRAFLHPKAAALAAGMLLGLAFAAAKTLPAARLRTRGR